MKTKLFILFCKKMKFMTIMFGVLFLVAGVDTQFNLTLVEGNYYKWEMVRALDETWYYYPYNPIDSISLSTYLRANYGAMQFETFRSLRDPLITQCDKYSYGDIFQITESELERLRKEYPEAELIVPVSQIVKMETDFLSVLGMPTILSLVSIWIICIVYGILWFSFCMRRSGELLSYLIHIKMNKREIEKIFCLSPTCIPILPWVLSFGIFFLSYNVLFEKDIQWLAITLSDLHKYYRPYIRVEIAVVLIYFVTTFIFYFVCRAIWNRAYNRRLFNIEKMDDHLFISDLSVIDNLKLILIAQGFSENAAARNIKPLLDERGICANHKLNRFVEKIIFFEIQDLLLKSLDILP